MRAEGTNELMKHFTVWQWSDFVRGLVATAPRAAMEAHLASGCRRCTESVSVLRNVAVTARSEADYAPPDYAIRYAHAIFSLHRPEKMTFPRMLARLVHDSVLAPLPAGMRSQDRLSRHALYEAGSYYLDLQIQQQPRSGLVTLIGQLADRDNPSTISNDVPVWVMDGTSLVASTLCNNFGEFHLEYPPAKNLRLQVPLAAARKRLEVSLNRLSAASSSAPQPSGAARRKTKPKPKAKS
jgi:hypothetical protein